MPYRHISRDLKECAIHLWDSGWELEDICIALGISTSSCYITAWQRYTRQGASHM
ncbi:hypothetical protein PISMIDRAFT_118774 [Pisolithus microcarpus 441]|uniref:Uncharacterized protein n=1 Tax=Pisolithus microcarpus 441 TaxID=765257 RepID=A0A0C9XME2_9AGAM|nr:hypothetical protein PISMIDRAFT_118774 [Pisolithus microcarpus 441]